MTKNGVMPMDNLLKFSYKAFQSAVPLVQSFHQETYNLEKLVDFESQLKDIEEDALQFV